MLPTDLIGVSIFDTDKQQFNFHKGPIFAELILADELNRATPRTQSALLEAMEERQVTTEKETIPLPQPFFVIATQNPSYQTGTYLLPESQLDRFLMRLSIGYPPENAERSLLKNPKPNKDFFNKPQVISINELIHYKEQAEKINVAEVILDYVQMILKASRTQGWFVHGLSPRAGMGIISAGKAYALTLERDYVKQEDIQAVLPAIVNHRLIAKNDHQGSTPSDKILNEVEVPI